LGLFSIEDGVFSFAYPMSGGRRGGSSAGSNAPAARTKSMIRDGRAAYI
jgi:hypothetical protein